MRLLLIIFGLFCGITTNAQWVWQGGTPVKPTAWEEPRNWNLNRVPEAGAHVRIPALSNTFYPEITTEVPAIAHLEVEGGATLSIRQTGALDIDGSSTFNVGILLTGKILNLGYLSVYHTAQEEIVGNRSHLITALESGDISFLASN